MCILFTVLYSTVVALKPIHNVNEKSNKKTKKHVNYSIVNTSHFRQQYSRERERVLEGESARNIQYTLVGWSGGKSGAVVVVFFFSLEDVSMLKIELDDTDSSSFHPQQTRCLRALVGR